MKDSPTLMIGKLCWWRYNYIGKPQNIKWDPSFEPTKMIAMGFLETLWKLRLYE